MNACDNAVHGASVMARAKHRNVALIHWCKDIRIALVATILMR